MPGNELIGKEELDQINSLFDGDPVLFTHGFVKQRKYYKVRDFENKINNTFDVKNSLCVSSGTAALTIALKAVGIGPGDEVITQAFTFIAVIEAIKALGANPIIIGIDATLNMDPKEIEKNITKRTKAIIPVHMLGVACEMDEIIKIANNYGIPIIEDACESIGGEYRGKKLGTIGDAGCFSFDFGKNITTGEGGAILTNNKKIYEYIKMYHDHGHCNLEGVPRGLDDIGMLGFNYRMTEISGAIGLAQIEKLGYIINESEKRYNAIENLISKKFLMRTVPANSKPAFDTIIFEVDDIQKKQKIINLLNKIGISTKNLPDAMRWHCAYYWKHLINMSDEIGVEKAQKKLEKQIAIPISLKKNVDDYEKLGDEINKL
jgi:8-amino-3,8-dideoxy-alpha-D-manno-octulosonate transaminase